MPSFVAVEPPLKLSINAWPFLLCQKPIVAVSPLASGATPGQSLSVPSPGPVVWAYETSVPSVPAGAVKLVAVGWKPAVL